MSSSTSAIAERIWRVPAYLPYHQPPLTDEAVAELRQLLPGDALRYPEVPEDADVLFVTDGARGRVLEACLSCRIPLRPLREYLEDPPATEDD